jgi:hypothetical protein
LADVAEPLGKIIVGAKIFPNRISGPAYALVTRARSAVRFRDVYREVAAVLNEGAPS